MTAAVPGRQIEAMSHRSRFRPICLAVLALGAGIRAFDPASRYRYFTRVRVDGRESASTSVAHFHARIRDGSVVLSFALPLDIRPVGRPLEVEVRVYDETRYVAFELSGLQDPSPSPAASFELEIRREPAIFSMTSFFGGAYLWLRATPAASSGGEADPRSAIGPSSVLAPLAEGSLPLPSADNPFLVDQSIFATPPTINPFLGAAP